MTASFASQDLPRHNLQPLQTRSLSKPLSATSPQQSLSMGGRDKVWFGFFCSLCLERLSCSRSSRGPADYSYLAFCFPVRKVIGSDGFFRFSSCTTQQLLVNLYAGETWFVMLKGALHERKCSGLWGSHGEINHPILATAIA